MQADQWDRPGRDSRRGAYYPKNIGMAKLTKTSTPGIFRRHRNNCTKRTGRSRCDCPYVVVHRHRGKQVTETFDNFELAREAQGRRQAGDRRPTSKERFGDYFARWIETYSGRTSRGFSETTRPEYRRPIEAHALSRWRTWRLADFEPADFRELFGAMHKDGRSTSQIKKLRAALSALFATAVEDGHIQANPCRGVRIPVGQVDEPSDDRAKALTRRQLGVLLAALPGSGDEEKGAPDWRLFFEFLTVTGLRISETVGLNWEHVKLGGTPRIEVREQVYRGKRRKLKSGAGRRDIPLASEMAKRLLAHRHDTYGGPKAPLFPSGAGTPLIRGKVAERALNPAREAAGLPWVSFHTFRHTCASLLFDNGRNPKQVADWLGHADPGFTLSTYVHLLDDGVGEGLDVPGRVNTGSTEGPETAEEAEAADTHESVV